MLGGRRLAIEACEDMIGRIYRSLLFHWQIKSIHFKTAGSKISNLSFLSEKEIEFYRFMGYNKNRHKMGNGRRGTVFFLNSYGIYSVMVNKYSDRELIECVRS